MPLEDELTAAGLTDGGAIRVRKLSYVEPVSQHQQRLPDMTCTLYVPERPLSCYGR